MKHLLFAKQNAPKHWIFQGSATAESKYFSLEDKTFL
jgi:hypothetical protein